MRREETMCPILTAAQVVAASVNGLRNCQLEHCHPDSCMWAMRKTAKGDDGRFHTVGYRCAVATGSDRYVDRGEPNADS